MRCRSLLFGVPVRFFVCCGRCTKCIVRLRVFLLMLEGECVYFFFKSAGFLFDNG